VRALLVPALLVAGALGPWTTSPVSAQAARDLAPAWLDVSVGVTSVVGQTSPTAAGSLLLGVAPGFSLGGGGRILLGTRALAGPVPEADQRLRFAYGGLLGQMLLSDTADRRVWIRLLAGAGNGKVDLAATGTPVASDNFGVVEPEVGGALLLWGPLHAGAAVAYRIVFGVEDLQGVTTSDLRGPTARLFVAVRRF
jgi:hypothetical protein